MKRKRYLTTAEVVASAVKARNELNMVRRLASEGSVIQPHQDNGGPPVLTRVKLDAAGRLDRARAAAVWVQHAETSVRHLRVVLDRMIEELEKELTWL